MIAAPAPRPLLPALRPEIALTQEAGRGLVYDPMTHRYVQIDAISAAIVAGWIRARDPLEVAAIARSILGHDLNASALGRVVDFARRNGWLLPADAAAVSAMPAQDAKAEHHGWRWLMRNWILLRVRAWKRVILS